MVFWAAENIKIIFAKCILVWLSVFLIKKKAWACVCVCLSDCERAWESMRVRESAWESVRERERLWGSVRERESEGERDRDLTTYLSRLQHCPTFPCDKLGRVKEERGKKLAVWSKPINLIFWTRFVAKLSWKCTGAAVPVLKKAI